jgi:conjugative relaxase-like TrwC/TraI family protein
MLTIRAAQNAPYYEQREFLRDDYYLEHDHAPGTWVGRGAELLELEGAPERGALGALLEGAHPASGERLPGLSAQRKNAGFDLTFTAPKSVSVLMAVGDECVRAAVRAAHEAGVCAGVDYLERHELQARRGHAGARIVAASGFAGARYTHEMSRSGDPHLHTHVVVANAVRGPDGRWTAPDMRPIYAAAKTAGTIAEAVMRDELSRALGLQWGAVANGSAEIAGLPRAVLDHFSQRHAEIEDALAARQGARTIQVVGTAQRATRDRKPVIDRDAAQADWRARAAEHGLDARAVRAVLGHAPAPSPTPAEIARIAEWMAGPDGLTKQASTFTRREVVRAWAEAHPGGIAPQRLEALTGAFIAQMAITVEPAHADVGRRATYTTEDMLRAERRLIEAATAPAARAIVVRSETVAQVLAERPHLGYDQRAAVRHLVTGDERTRLLEARAGRGKTTALEAVVACYRSEGIPVMGCAWQGQAARVLEDETGIPSETIARLLWRLTRNYAAIPPHAVVIVDEAATVPTRALADLAQAVAEQEARLILVGDRAQLPAVDAGGGFAGLAQRLGAAELTDNRRQRDPLQRQIADLLGEQNARAAIALIQEHGRLHVAPDSDAAREALVADWAAACAHDPSRALIIAHDRADVRALNALARAAREELGHLGPERITASGREWAAGDRLVCRRNDYRPELDVRNGTRGTVERVDPATRSLVLLTDEGRRVALPPEYLEHAHHGYAVSGHVSQGATCERTFLLATPERGGAEWAYVAASRHRIELSLYAPAPDAEPVAEALSRAWERRQAKSLALDRIEGRADGASTEARRAAGAPVRLDALREERFVDPAAGAPVSAGAPERDPLAPDRAPAETKASSPPPDAAAALCAEREALQAEVRSCGPPTPAEAPEELREERARLERARAQVVREREQAEDGLAGLSRWRLVGRAGQDEAAAYRTQIERAQERERGLEAQIADLSARQREARAQQVTHETWRVERLPQIVAHIEDLDAELCRHEAAPGAAPGAGDVTRSPRPAGAGHELWAERTVLAHHRDAGGPPTPRPELVAHVHDAHERAQQDLREAERDRDRLSERLEAMGPLARLRRSGREEAAGLERQVADARRFVDVEARDAAAWAERAGGIDQQLAERERWEREARPVLAQRIDAIDRELGARVAARVRAAETQLPAYIAREIPALPRSESNQSQLSEAIRAVETYRERYGITDPERALGERPADEARAMEHFSAGQPLDVAAIYIANEQSRITEAARWAALSPEEQHEEIRLAEERRQAVERAHADDPLHDYRAGLRADLRDDRDIHPHHGPSLGR